MIVFCQLLVYNEEYNTNDWRYTMCNTNENDKLILKHSKQGSNNGDVDLDEIIKRIQKPKNDKDEQGDD